MDTLIKDLGALRISLFVLAAMAVILRPSPGAYAARSGIEVIPTLVAPAMTPLIFMVLMFDFMMCRIRMSDEQQRSKFRRISYIELTVALLLFLIWLPYFVAIGN
ncbi:MAG: hypothetical protein AAF304_00510 [Pseudomonadota bacterium]